MGPQWLPNYLQPVVPSVPSPWKDSRPTETLKHTRLSLVLSQGQNGKFSHFKSDLFLLKPIYKKKKEGGEKKTQKNPLVSIFTFDPFLQQILVLKELERGRRQCLSPGLGAGWHLGRPWWRQRYVVALPCTTSRINYWLQRYSLAVGSPWFSSLILGICAAWDLAGHLIDKPRVTQVSSAEFQAHAPIWVMYSFRSQGWALNKA